MSRLDHVVSQITPVKTGSIRLFRPDSAQIDYIRVKPSYRVTKSNPVPVLIHTIVGNMVTLNLGQDLQIW